jgi:hypothetical protein
MTAAFQTFQRDFARHLRDPHHVPRPNGLPARRVGVYSELVFNNLCGFLDSCFPVCRGLLGELRWRRLCRTFQRDWPLHTPWFREIPQEFVNYLAAGDIRQPLPAWLTELAHYEWAELAVDVLNTPSPSFDPAGDLLAAPVVLNPALLNLAYAWPVHKIGLAYRPRRPQATHLVVYRDAHDSICFSEINPLTARLLTFLATPGTSGQQAVVQLAAEINHPDPSSLLGFAGDLFNSLRQQGIILGSQA